MSGIKLREMDFKNERSPVNALFWRDEILQLMYWMVGEGLSEEVTVDEIIPFLNSNKENLSFHLDKMTREGYLQKTSRTGTSPYYNLTSFGKTEAGRRFSEAFQGLQAAGHGECGPDCEFCYGPQGEKLENCVHNCSQQDRP